MISRRSIFAFVPLPLLALAACGEPGPPTVTRPPLAMGETRPGILVKGVHDVYEIDLRTGEGVRLEIDQSGGDVEAIVEGPGGEIVLRYDTPVGEQAPERPCFVASAAGVHRLRVAPFDDRPVGYTIKLLSRRPATPADRACAVAARLIADALGRRDEAGSSPHVAADLQRAATLWHDADETLSEALAHREAGKVLHDLGRSAEAMAELRRALASSQAAGSSYLELNTRNHLGVVLYDRGDLAAAEGVLNEALAAARAAADQQREEAFALNNLGLVAEAVGEVHQAIELYQRAAEIQRRLGKPADLAQTLQNLGSAIALLDHHQEALEVLDEALELVRQGSSRVKADILTAIGWVHYQRGKPGQAVTAFNEALALRHALGDRGGEAAVLDRLGTALREAGDADGALAAYQESLALSLDGGSPWDVASTTANLGCTYQELGDESRAEHWLRDARRRFEAIDDPKAHSHVESCLARLARQRGDLAAALEHIEAALSIVDEMKKTSRQAGARHRPIWLWQDYAELHTELLLAVARQNRDVAFTARAFEVADYARARSLYEMVVESQLPPAPEGTAYQRQRELSDRLHQLQVQRRQLDANGAPEKEIAELEARLGVVSLELGEARAALRAAGPRFAALAAPRPVPLGEVQELLGPDTTMLRYFLGETGSHLFVVRADSVTVLPLPARATLEAHAKALHTALRESFRKSRQARLLAHTSTRLLLPAGALPAGTRRLWVVADGALHYVPFAALPVPISEAEDGEELLVERLEIRYLPSASVAVALARRAAARPPAPRTVAVFADPVFSDDDERLNGGQETDRDGRQQDGALGRLLQRPLPRLPYTRHEADAILSRVAEEERFQAFDFSADKSAALSPVLERYRILHFATHAFIDERFPELSGLVLSRRDAQGRVVDGDLYLHEIFDLDLRADLAVLSGCQTALGPRVRGDGLLSLTRGFFYAGCSQVMVSLWSVDDRATATLMAQLYRALLEEGRSPAAALRAAQLSMLRQQHEPAWHAPYYWAPFILQGTEPPR